MIVLIARALIIFLLVHVLLQLILLKVPKSTTSNLNKKGFPNICNVCVKPKNNSNNYLNNVNDSFISESELRCLSGWGYFKRATHGCIPRKKIKNKVRDDNTLVDLLEDTVAHLREELRPTVEKLKQEWKRRIKLDREQLDSPVIYQIITVILIISLTASLVDCFKERFSKRSQDINDPNSLTRKMSLADLTMSRHARRESQLASKPSTPSPEAGQHMDQLNIKDNEMSTILESKEKKIKRQTTWPRRISIDLLNTNINVKLTHKYNVNRLSEFGKQVSDSELMWAERRRVRMIHRH